MKSRMLGDETVAIQIMRETADEYEENPDGFVAMLFCTVTRGDSEGGSGKVSCMIRPDLGATVETIDDIVQMVKQALFESLEENEIGDVE